VLTIQEQENLTIIGRKNVILNFGINVKQSSNLIIRNISIQNYYGDGINIGEPETHHVWVDHCTVIHPTSLPADSEHQMEELM
jgi:pectate lyase